MTQQIIIMPTSVVSEWRCPNCGSSNCRSITDTPSSYDVECNNCLKCGDFIEFEYRVPDSAAAEAEFETTNPALMYLADKAPLTQKSHGNLLSKFARRFFRVWSAEKGLFDFGGYDLNDPMEENEDDKDKVYADLTTANWRQLRAKHVVLCKKWLKDKGLKMATIHAYVSALKGVARQSTRLGIIAADVRLGIDDVEAKQPTDTKQGRALDPEEVARLIASCDDDGNRYLGIRDAALLALMTWAGFRRVDCENLRVGDVRKNCTEFTVKGKGGRVDRLPFNPLATKRLSAWMKLREKWVGKAPEKAMFCRVRKGGVISPDEPLTADGISYIVKRRVNAAAVHEARPHDFRRTFVTALLDKGHPAEVVRQLARHAKVQTTLGYDMRAKERAEKVILEVNFLEK